MSGKQKAVLLQQIAVRGRLLPRFHLRFVNCSHS